eukprot:SAG31_NODE_3037_length_4761_cov_2.884384_8_plen_71_part_00
MQPGQQVAQLHVGCGAAAQAWQWSCRRTAGGVSDEQQERGVVVLMLMLMNSMVVVVVVRGGVCLCGGVRE